MCRAFFQNSKIIKCWEQSDLLCTQAKKDVKIFQHHSLQGSLNLLWLHTV